MWSDAITVPHQETVSSVLSIIRTTQPSLGLKLTGDKLVKFRSSKPVGLADSQRSQPPSRNKGLNRPLRGQIQIRHRFLNVEDQLEDGLEVDHVTLSANIRLCDT